MDCNKSLLKSPKPKSNEEIVAGFQALRAEQRRIANKLAEIDGDQKEHRTVIDALRLMDGERKAFRLVGGVLTERTVAAVLPELEDALQKLPGVLQMLETQMQNKGAELAAYVTEHNLRISQDDPPSPARPDPTNPNVLLAP